MRVPAFFLFLTFIFLTTPLFAAGWQEEVVQAVNNGNFSEIDVTAATYPEQQGPLALFLLQEAHDKLDSNPALASQLFAIAATYVSQISSEKTASIKSVIQVFFDRARNSQFQSSHAQEAGDIFAALIYMAQQNNIAALLPEFQDQVLADAKDYLANYPQAPDRLRKIVSLAQSQSGGAPTIGVLGASIPSAE